MFTCVGWQVTLCDPIWQVTLFSSVGGSIFIRAIFWPLPLPFQHINNQPRQFSLISFECMQIGKQFA